MLNRQIKTEGWRSAKKGFTLIELLVVIAITSVLLFLIFGPLVEGFQLTARAQTTTEAQDAARVAMEQISREIGSASAIRDTSHQYLHLRIYDQDGTETVANAYNAYIDLVPPRSAVAVGGYVDPTYNPSSKTITLKPSTSGSNVATYSGATLPVAPGTTLVRYFVGLRYPINLNYPGTTAQEQPYTNSNEGQTVDKSDPTFGKTYVVGRNLDNTYILYRAEVEPFAEVTTGAKKSYEANSLYFDKDSSDNPILDDPDFFRVTSNAAHNLRVYHWFQAAKPVIDVGDANLIFQGHDAKGNVAYDGSTGWPAGTQTDFDGAPIVRTSVSFAPATISNDPMNATVTSDISQGYGISPADTPGSDYIPTQYQAQYGQWHGGPNVQINGPGGAIYNTFTFENGTPPTGAALGDLIEANGASDVFDVTSQTVLNSATNYVAMTVDGDDGLVNFAIPDIPAAEAASGGTPVGGSGNIAGNANGTNPGNPYWYFTYGQATTEPAVPITLDIQPVGAPTSDPNLLQSGGAYPKAATVTNARVVANSERVYGPEEDAGPGSADPSAMPSSGDSPVTYPLVPYRRIPFTQNGDATIGVDQYMIDYTSGIIYLGMPGTTLNLTDQYPQRRTMLVAFSYQNNLIPGTPAQADTLRATYQTGSQMEISLGIRVYDPSDKHPTYFSLTSRVGVGNASR